VAGTVATHNLQRGNRRVSHQKENSDGVKIDSIGSGSSGTLCWNSTKQQEQRAHNLCKLLLLPWPCQSTDPSHQEILRDRAASVHRSVFLVLPKYIAKMCNFPLVCLGLNFEVHTEWRRVKSRTTAKGKQILAVSPLESVGQKPATVASDRMMSHVNVLGWRSSCVTALSFFFRGKNDGIFRVLP
jgi:hypothetical protein